MNLLLIILAAVAPASTMLMTFLYIFLAIVLLGGVIWAINKYIHPIPPPILLVLAVVLIIVMALWLLEGPPPR